MDLLFLLIIGMHALIHLIGFARAFFIKDTKGFHKPVGEQAGLFWLFAFLLFIPVGMLFIMNHHYWWFIALPAILLSQVLIFFFWRDARFGTIANVIILAGVASGFCNSQFYNSYSSAVEHELMQKTAISTQALTEADIAPLPELIRKYIRLTGSIGKHRVENFAVEMEGSIRKNNESVWMPFSAVQHNFLIPSSRYFYMNATMFKLPVAGFHSFTSNNTFMDIRLLSMIKVQYKDGNEMSIAETVTFFNDMCCMAPATLIDKRITWLEQNSRQVKAAFTNNGITIEAWLHFNESGELINFVSDDRYAVTADGTMKKVRWSTPISNYAMFNGYRLAAAAETIYGFPEGNLVYGKFRTLAVTYNVKSNKHK